MTGINMIKLELTEEELQFIYERCSNKAARLEDSNLEDTPCYRLSWAVMNKILNIKQEKKNKNMNRGEKYV